MAKFKQVKTIYPSARPLQERKSSMLPNAARRGISVDGITPISEGKVLKPIDKTKQTDSDTWPCYVLEDTIVYKNGDKSQLCSVLHTELDGPLTIEGKLDPTSLDKKIAKNLMPAAKNALIGPALITIYNSNEFSIDEEGTIWASGNAGWFEIRPAVHYQEIYDQMQEGVRLFYDLEDVLSNTKATYRHKVGMGDLFVKYRTKLAGKKVKDIEAFKELLHTHTQFLLGHMKPGSVENINWQAMPVFRYLRDNAVDIYERYYGPIPPAKASTSGASGRQSSIKKEDENDQNTLAKLKTVKKVAKSALKVEESDSDEEMFDAEPAVPKTPAQERPQRQYAGKGSTRRPVTTPATSAGKKNSKTMSDDDEDEEEIVQPDEKRRRISAFPGISGRIATKEKKPKTKKEKSLTAEEKRARRLQETADLPSSHAGSSPEPSDDEAGKPHLALVNVEMGQSIKPNAPNGFWICERPECGHLEIPFAESENGKANIRNHWLWHADDIEKKSGIIHEFAKPYLNTENLVKYFDSLHKKMAEAGVEKPKVDVRVEGAVEKDGKGRVMPRRPKRTGFNVSAEVLSGRTNLPWSADAD